MNKVFGRIVMGLIVLGIPFALTSCLNGDESEDPLVRLTEDIETIENYLTTNNINFVRDPNGIFMVITKLGTGLPANGASEVDVDYIGKVFGSSTPFDEGNATGALQGYIQGWKYALTSLPAGSKATLFIPSYWGYGSVQNGTIPPNSILVFDIAFNEVIGTAAEAQRLGTDTVAIDNYLDSKSITAEKDTTGIRYVITQTGTGPTPTWYDRVKIAYSFKVLTDDTKIVYEGSAEPNENFYSRVIDYIYAMQIGLQKLPEGSKVTIYAPSGLAFGADQKTDNAGQVLIPANSNLIIDLELIELVQP
jgi:FKBP-type peptidyl-prolyl cis-trans isomerase